MIFRQSVQSGVEALNHGRWSAVRVVCKRTWESIE